jgi:hypothetical protein
MREFARYPTAAMAVMKNIAPHRFELWLRFLAGAGFGVLITGIPLAIGWPFSRGLFAAVVGVSGLAFGVFALRSSDRFWRTARDWLWLFWP